MQAEYVEVYQAAREAGIERNTARRRLMAAGVTMFLDPKDHRRRLVRRTDFEAAIAPRPIGRPRKESPAA